MEYQIIPVQIAAPRYLDELNPPSFAVEWVTSEDGHQYTAHNISDCIDNLVLDPCWDIVVAHPSQFPGEFAIGGYFDVTPAFLIGFALQYHYWEPYNNIWLWCCRSGSTGLAQSISNISGFPVKAPYMTLYCEPNGCYFVTDMPIDEVEEIIQNELEQEIFNEAEQSDKWNIFYPNDVLTQDEQDDLENAVAAFLPVLLKRDITFDEYCQELIENGDITSVYAIHTNIYQRRAMWASLLNY